MPASPRDFLPFYQPIVGLSSGRIEGYELLARSLDAHARPVSAGAFFSDPAVEAEYKLDVDRSLRQRAFKCFAQRPEHGFLSINIPPAWIMRLGQREVSPTLRMIDEAGLDPARVIVEITESNGELEQLRRLVKQYRRAGIRVAIDDFGAQDSQIDRVIALEPDLIKLDMQLFQRAARGHASADILLAMMALAERAGCRVVCEGVETDDEFYFGIECGAHLMQGYRFSAAVSQPLTADASASSVAELLRQYQQLKTTRLHQVIDRAQELKSAIGTLRRQLLQGDPLKIDPNLLAQNGALRFFLCDRTGLQTSPNYELGIDRIDVDPQFQGHNWSWRPYFPMLLAMQNRSQSELVASAAYRDVTSRRLCKTFGLFLDAERILLVDAQVFDEVISNRRIYTP